MDLICHADSWTLRPLKGDFHGRKAAASSGSTSSPCISAAILIGAEVFGAAFAGSWALATLFDLGSIGQRILDGIFVLCGIAIMVQFIRNAHRIEPFTARN